MPLANYDVNIHFRKGICPFALCIECGGRLASLFKNSFYGLGKIDVVFECSNVMLNL